MAGTSPIVFTHRRNGFACFHSAIFGRSRSLRAREWSERFHHASLPPILACSPATNRIGGPRLSPRRTRRSTENARRIMVRQSAFVHAPCFVVSSVVRIAVYLTCVTRRDASTGETRRRGGPNSRICFQWSVNLSKLNGNSVSSMCESNRDKPGHDALGNAIAKRYYSRVALARLSAIS